MTGPSVIVVPTSRQLDQTPGVDLALNIGEHLRCHVLVICSRDARPAHFPWDKVSENRRGLVHVIDFDEVHSAWWGSDDGVNRHPSGYDVANKRNMALALACFLRWGQVLFLDDDMAESPEPDGLNAATVAFASRWMRAEGVAAVGWRCTDFPDNSAVCHARRTAGQRQETFIGSGALLVSVDTTTPYFPDMYNEDWLFLMEVAARHKDRYSALARAGSVRQLEYDPYVDSRIQRQEMGDVLAECLLNVLEEGDELSSPAAPARGGRFWTRAVRSRRLSMSVTWLLLAILALVRPDRRRSRLRAMSALKRAALIHRRLKATDFVEWVTEWHAEQQRWTRYLQRLTATWTLVDTVPQVMATLAAGYPPRATATPLSVPRIPAAVSSSESVGRGAPQPRVAEPVTNHRGGRERVLERLGAGERQSEPGGLLELLGG